MVRHNDVFDPLSQFCQLHEMRSGDSLLPGLKLLLSLTHDIVIIRDLENRILFWNEQATALFGWCVEEVLGQNIATLLNSRVFPSYAIIKETLFAQGQWRGEILCSDREGHPLFISSHQTLLCNPDGEAEAILSIDCGIAPLRQRQTSLQNMNLGLFSINEQWLFTYADKKAAQLLDKAHDELIGKHILDVFPQFMDTDIATVTQNAMAYKQKVHIALPVAERWLDVEIDAYEYGLFFLLKDITHYKEMERTLRVKEKKLQRIIDANIVGFVSVDDTGTVLETNDAFLNLIGYTRAEFEAAPLHMTAYTPPEYHKTSDDAIHIINKTGGPYIFEKELIRKDQQRVPVSITSIAFDEGNRTYFSLVMDLTAQKQLDAQKELFMSILGHELRTPLTAITGSIQLARRRLSTFQRNNADSLAEDVGLVLKKLDKILDQTLRQTRIQNRLINDLLDISRLAIDKLELQLAPTNLMTIVRDTVEDMRYTTPDRVIEVIAPANPLIAVNIDADRVGQVMTNYISNAIKYSPPSQPIVVEFTLENDVVRVCVCDKGPGLSPEMQAHIWDRYYRVPVHNNGKNGVNLGLGLYICQVLIKRHHGEVGVESTPGQGSSFWFSLPLLPTPSAR